MSTDTSLGVDSAAIVSAIRRATALREATPGRPEDGTYSSTTDDVLREIRYELRALGLEIAKNSKGPRQPPIPDRVAAGARLLDQHVPDWESRVTLPITKMWSPDSVHDDPVTQAFTDEPLVHRFEAYDLGRKTLGLSTFDEAAAHGFDTVWPGNGPGVTSEQAHDYRLLARAWTNYIEARLATFGDSPDVVTADTLAEELLDSGTWRTFRNQDDIHYWVRIDFPHLTDGEHNDVVHAALCMLQADLERREGV